MTNTNNACTLTRDDLQVLFEVSEWLDKSHEDMATALAIADSLAIAVGSCYNPQCGLIFSDESIVYGTAAIRDYAEKADAQLSDITEKYLSWYSAKRNTIPDEVFTAVNISPDNGTENA